MFRRRRPLGPRRAPVDRAQLLLNQAHRLFESGQYLQAARLFEQLAQGATRRQLPRAPFLFLQAGKAYLFGGQEDQGMALIRAGLKTLAVEKRWPELERVGRRTVAELAEQGFTGPSEEIKGWLDETLSGIETSRPRQVAAGKAGKAALPTKCPSCGGSVDPQAVTWLDDVTAECLYCGSAIRAEN